MTHILDELEVIWPLHRRHYLSPALTAGDIIMPTAPEASDGPPPPTEDGAPTGRDLAVRALLAGPDGAPQRIADLLDVSRQTIDRMADADLSPAATPGNACAELEVIWPLHRRHYLSPPDPGILDAGDEPVSVPLVATTGRELAARALLAGPDGAPQRVGELLELSRGTIDRMADADLSPALRNRVLLEEARTCLAETAGRGSTVEEREAAVAWLENVARDEHQAARAQALRQPSAGRQGAVQPRRARRRVSAARHGGNG